MEPSTPSLDALDLRAIAGPQARTIALKPPGPVSVGRLPLCEVVLDDPAVSRRHATFMYRDHAWFITDAGSRHGTQVNGKDAAQGEWLGVMHGDHVTIGPWTFRAVEPDRHVHTSRTLADFTEGSSAVKKLDDEPKALPGHLLSRLLECAGGVAGASREDALLSCILDNTIAGLMLENAAFIRPTTDPAVVEVVAVKSSGDRVEAFRFSRSLIATAAGGSVAVLNPGVASHSIDALGIVAALCAPVVVDSTIVGYLYADRRRGGTHIHSDAGGFFDALAKLAGLGLANLRRRTVEARQSDLERELVAAQEAQRYLLPKPNGSVGRIEYAMISRPGRLLSGDLFSVFALPDSRVACFLGDVSGKGTAAAVLMSGLQARVSAVLRLTGDLRAAITDANEYAAMHAAAGRFVTLWAAILDPDDSTMQIIDAGHGLTALAPPDEHPMTLQVDGGPPLGVDGDYPYEVVERPLSPGSRLVLFTDGVSEQCNLEARQFGVGGLLGSLRPATDPKDEVAHIMARLLDYAGTSQLMDDSTVAVLRVV